MGRVSRQQKMLIHVGKTTRHFTLAWTAAKKAPNVNAIIAIILRIEQKLDRPARRHSSRSIVHGHKVIHLDIYRSEADRWPATSEGRQKGPSRRNTHARSDQSLKMSTRTYFKRDNARKECGESLHEQIRFCRFLKQNRPSREFEQ